MTKQQEELLRSVLNVLSVAQTMAQVDSVWSTVEAACRQANINPGSKPTSVPQARSVANSLKRHLG